MKPTKIEFNIKSSEMSLIKRLMSVRMFTTLSAMKNVDWKPNITELAKVTGYPTSTVYDQMKKILNQLEIEVNVRLRK